MVRRHEEKDLFDDTLCAERWTRDYYFNTQWVFLPFEEQLEVPESVLSLLTLKKKVLSEHEKYRKANEVVKKLPSLVTEVGTKNYLQRFKVLVER